MQSDSSGPNQAHAREATARLVPGNVLANKDAGAALDAVQEYAEAIVQTMPDALLVLDTDLRVKFANDAFYTTFQVQREATENALVYELGNGQWNIPELRLLLEAILPANKTFTGYEIDHEFEQLGRRVMLLNGRRLDHVQLILLIMTDITAARQSEAASRASEDLMRLLVESVKDYAICTLDPTGRVTSWNEGGRRLMGYTAEEMVGQSVHRIYLPTDLAGGKPESEMQTVLATGRSEDESWRVRKDGSRFWANEIITPLRAEDGTQHGFAKVTRDLSEQRQAQEALAAGKERLRLIMESINDHAIFTLDPAGHIVDWYSGAEQVFGYTAEEAIGQPSAVVFTPEDRAKGMPEQEMQQARTTGRAADERWHMRKDGTRFWASGVLAPLQAGAGSGYVKVARDLTERRMMEERLEAQVKQRTAQVRELATRLTMSEQEERRRISAILHDDLQQRLFSFVFQLAALRQAHDGAQTETAQQLIGAMEEALRGSIQLTRELSIDLSPPVLHGEGLAAAVQWLATQMGQQQGLAVDIQAEQGLPMLGEDMRVLLFQTVRELLFNVVKHAGVKAASVKLVRAGEYLRVEVGDQGRGFAPGADGSGATSQGLRLIEQKMQLLGGSMEITSAPGRGTQVALFVPLRNTRGNQV